MRSFLLTKFRPRIKVDLSIYENHQTTTHTQVCYFLRKLQLLALVRLTPKEPSIQEQQPRKERVQHHQAINVHLLGRRPSHNENNEKKQGDKFLL